MGRLVLVVLLAGCSFATSGAPARLDSRTAPDCTTSRAAPIVDTTAAILLGFIGLSMVLAKDSCPDDGSSCDDPYASRMRGGGVLALSFAAVYTVGAVVGFSHVSSCEAAVRRYQTGARR